MEFVFSTFKLKINSFNGIFKIFGKHSSLNGCLHEDSEKKTANVFSLICSGHGDISVNAL